MIDYKDFPEKINILGIEYKLKISNQSKAKEWGEIIHNERIIYIYDNNRPHKELWGVILHEVIHGIVAIMSISLGEKSEDEEMNTSILAIGLMNVIFDNKLNFFGNLKKG